MIITFSDRVISDSKVERVNQPLQFPIVHKNYERLGIESLAKINNKHSLLIQTHVQSLIV